MKYLYTRGEVRHRGEAEAIPIQGEAGRDGAEAEVYLYTRRLSNTLLTFLVPRE
jgi:hypothetical protein